MAIWVKTKIGQIQSNMKIENKNKTFLLKKNGECTYAPRRVRSYTSLVQQNEIAIN